MCLIHLGLLHNIYLLRYCDINCVFIWITLHYVEGNLKVAFNIVFIFVFCVYFKCAEAMLIIVDHTSRVGIIHYRSRVKQQQHKKQNKTKQKQIKNCLLCFYHLTMRGKYKNPEVFKNCNNWTLISVYFLNISIYST